MGVYSDFLQAMQEINRKRNEWQERALDTALKWADKVSKDIYDEFGQVQRQLIEDAFRNAVTSFYKAYEPWSYVRQGDPDTETGGLYNLFQTHIPTDERGLVNYSSAMDLIDPSQMTLDRHGNNTLFDLVFMEGWHGGAKYIAPRKEARWHKHPNPGTPHYRSGFWYEHWGEQAFRSTPPYDIFESNIINAENNEMKQAFSDIAHRVFNEESPNLQHDLNILSKEIFG